ncbi:hypothetical protein ACFQ48_20600 [Hymenobacter caeli]|uniref:Uncharacterized protein n=1 Tax=Hymenobacter caeli TaxID=2735894 RepID=A0ABX2FWK5_9BACT|nr:hypothetical protein [Hymenobacter caeli]NRT21367.1 hypothetical protein [Hymenobacter caeli]
MRFGWIAPFVPDARGVRWAFGLLLLPAVWLAKGGSTPGPAAPVAVRTEASTSAAPRYAQPAPDSVRTVH